MRGLLFLAGVACSVALAQAPKPGGAERAPLIKPIDLLKCKPASSQEEAKAREAAEIQNFSDHEVLGRLIYSEGLATGFFAQKCKSPSADSLMEAIGWVVLNRVDKYSPRRDDPKSDALFHVVFAKNQFATSFRGKSNPFARAFLCPLEAQKYLESVKSTDNAYSIYQQAKEIAAKLLDKYQRGGIDVRFSKLNHFFFPYSESGGGKRPTWAKDPDPAKNPGYVKIIEGEKPCAEFYKR